MGIKTFNTKLSTLTKDYDLRADPKFYELIDTDDFIFVKNEKCNMIELRQILKPSYKKFEFEEGKIYKGLLTDADFFDEEGNILDYIDLTKENHPDRVKFRVSTGDIVISSLKGANVKPMLIDKEKTEYVWSDGFYIFRKVHEGFDNEFIFYIIKSSRLRNILDERLSRGIGISAYRERDLLRLKIPIIPREKQMKALEEIAAIEGEISELKETIPEMQQLIEKIMEDEQASSFKELEENKTKTFIKKFSEISSNLHLRCDPKYMFFWGITHGSIFRYNGKQIQLRQVLKPKKSKIIKKGLLNEKRILINKEDVEAKTGLILNEDYVDKIDSDKIIFGDADLLISKIDPFLGHVILNDKSKDMIGTTEFMAFKFRKDNDPNFIQFLLLSKAYLDITRFILSGKRQPRIDYYNLLRLKIPDITESGQKRVSSKIASDIGDLKSKKEILRGFRNDIEKILLASLSS